MPEVVAIDIDGHPVSVPASCTVAAAIALAAGRAGLVTRLSVNGHPRGPVCGMGICQECRVTIDGQAHRLACQTLCAAGMRIVTRTVPS